MIQFSTSWPSCFNEEHTVYRHEMGHALVWVASGGHIDRVRFKRTPKDRLLCGGMLMALPEGWTPERFGIEKPTQLAERVLAGEIAARIYNSLPLGVICTDVPVSASSSLAQLLRGRENDQIDHIKALFLAHETARGDWYTWLCDRYKAAQTLVELQFETIDVAADVFAGDIPLFDGEEQVIEGSRVARQLGFRNAAS